MNTALLTLTQWLSPAYPMGSFAYSHGLEQAVHRGWVSDANSLQAWLTDILLHGTGATEAYFITEANHGDDPIALDQDARAWASSRERLREAERQGATFVQVTNEVWGLSLPPLLLPVALGTAARQMTLPLVETRIIYLQSFASNLIACAQRLMPLGQTKAQRVLAQLAPVIENVEPKLSSTAFLSDIAAMQHETLEPRIFQT